MPSLLLPELTVSCFDDLDFFNDFKNEFPAIVYNDAQMFKSDLLTESILNPQHIDESDLNSEISFSEYDEEEQNVLYFNDLFPFNIIHLDDLKSEKDNNDKEIARIKSSRGDKISHRGTPFHFHNAESIRYMTPLPPREQRHPFLRYQGLEYTDADIADFEERLERIYSHEILRGQSESERMILGKGDLHDYWTSISTDGDFLVPPPSYTLIRDLVLRLCHRMMAHSIAGRSQPPKKFVARLAEHFRLLTAEILGARQPNAVASAPKVFEDAHANDQGSQADLAPVQGPQPPPPPSVAARTIP
nr:hypothetical protein [Tanacetum cinerariifolium]